jgi:competence protein ComEC
VGIGLGVGLLLGARAGQIGTEIIALLLLAPLVGIAFFLPRPVRWAVLASAAGCLLAVGLAWFRSDAVVPPLDLGESHFSGTLTTDPVLSGDGSRAGFRWLDPNGYERETQLYFPFLPEAGRGDRIEVSGQLEEPFGGRLFADSSRVVGRADRLELARRSIRHYVEHELRQRVPGPPGSLALGLLIGDDSGLTMEQRDQFRRVGLSHITAVSGWNVGVVIVVVAAVFQASRLRGWVPLLLVILMIGGYVWIVGPEPPVTRAAIMGSLVLVGSRLGRPTHGLTLLCLTAGAMAAIDPDLLGSLSFQLSILAMVGLVIGGTVQVQHRVGRLVLEPGIATVAAGLATAPLLAARFGTFSLATLPANILAAGAVVQATLSGFAVVVVGWVPVVGALVGWYTWLCCWWVLWVAAVFSELPGGYWEFPSLSPSATVALYLGLCLVALPFVPEGRLLLRRLERHLSSSPSEGVAASAGVLFVALLIVLAV